MASATQSFHVQVGSHMLLVEVSLSNDLKKCNKEEKCKISWFKNIHLKRLINILENVIVNRVNTDRPMTRAVNQTIEASKDIQSGNFVFNYAFKKRNVTASQFALRQIDTKVYNLYGKTKKSKKLRFESLLYFPEKLTVTAWKPPRKKKDETPSTISHENFENIDKPNSATSSNYFGEKNEKHITSSVKRKKATLKKLAKKSKIALMKVHQKEGKIENTNQEQHTISSSEENNCEEDNENIVIDLEEKPEGLEDVRRVEDLRLDQLKFLVYKMEEYLRKIFRGEVYCRRHEDYNKGGKNRDDLNFQVGMAHFNEDQHDCIMDTLMAIFCYKHLRYMDYVTKVILPETLIKLYQDIHKTTFEQAEDCLLNDTIK